MRVKSHMFLPAALMIVALLAVISAALRVWQVAGWNNDYYEMYEEYGDGVSEYTVEPGTTAEYLESFGDDYHDREFYEIPEGTTTVTLENELSYYDAPNGNVVLTLEPGEYLIASDRTVSCYGERSYPTETKGWRYARPFVKDGEEYGEPLFVKTDELLEITESIYGSDADKNIVTVGLTYDEDSHLVSKEMPRYEEYFFHIDRTMYGQGEFCSPDLEEPLFDGRTLFTGIAGVLLIGWSIVVFVVRNREENARVAAEQAEQDRAHAEAKAKHDEWMRTRAGKNRTKGKKKR